MTTIDLAKSFEKIHIIQDLEKRCTRNSVLGIAILEAINRKEKMSTIIEWVKDFSADNPGATISVIGEDLFERINSITL